MIDVLDMDSLHDEFIDAKDLMDKQLVCQNKPVDSKWVDILGEMKTNSYESKNLLLLVSKTLSIPCSNTFIEKILNLMSSCWTNTRNPCKVGLRRAELQVRANFRFDCSVQFYHYVKEKNNVLQAAGSSEKYCWKRRQQE